MLRHLPDEQHVNVHHSLYDWIPSHGVGVSIRNPPSQASTKRIVDLYGEQLAHGEFGASRSHLKALIIMLLEFHNRIHYAASDQEHWIQDVHHICRTYPPNMSKPLIY